jgi:Fe-S-cluster-containing hydrogenase component 2
VSETYAVRNIRLCTKDCLCLYVCATGATDTENSVIDPLRCTGCGACAGACPSGAIFMLPRTYPPQQKKSATVKRALYTLAKNRARSETIAAQLNGKLAAALEQSNRILMEDLFREAGFMLPQSLSARRFLQDALRQETDPAFPRAAAEALLREIKCNEPSDE